jgi:hypothetical protein
VAHEKTHSLCNKMSAPSIVFPNPTLFSVQKKSHLLLERNSALANRLTAPDASPPSAHQPVLVLAPAASTPCARRLTSLHPPVHAGPLPFADSRLRRLLISLRPPAPGLSGPPPHLTPPPPALRAACCHSPCLRLRLLPPATVMGARDYVDTLKS